MKKNTAKKELHKELENKVQPVARVMSLPETARGVYANVAVIKHTPREFVFDFMLVLEEEVQLVSRVIMGPAHTQSFLDALKQNMERYKLRVEDKKQAPKPDEITKVAS